MKKNKKQIILPLLGAILVSALVSGAIVSAQGGTTVLGKAIEFLKLVKELNNTPAETEVGFENVGAFVTPGSHMSDLEVLGDVLTGNSFSQRDDDDTSSSITQRFVDIAEIGVASSTYYSRLNSSTGDVYVRAMIQLDGTVSSTVRFSLGTSTVANAPDFNATGGIARGIINNVEVATGTINKVFDSVGNFMYDASRDASLVHGSSTWVRVPNGSYVIGYMTTGGSNAIQGSSATSSAGRGFSTGSRVLVEYMRVASGTYPNLSN